MIHSLKIRNFLSFKNETVFSFEATKDKNLEQYHIVEIAPNVRLNKLGIVYGANASGKSNLISAFNFLIKFWFRSVKSKNQGTNVIPFLLDNNSKYEPTEFCLTFFIENTKYVYKLQLDQNSVLHESMVYYPSTQPAEIFARDLKNGVSKIAFGSKLKLSALIKKEIELKCLPNISLFVAYHQVNINLPLMEHVSSWIRSKIIEPILPKTDLIGFTENLILKDSLNKDYILDFLNQADFNIDNINVREIDTSIDESKIKELSESKSLPKKIKEDLKKTGKLNFRKTEFSHKVIDDKGKRHLFTLPERLQSDGTMRSMGLSGALNYIIQNNAFTAIDEVESSMHPKLIEFLIETFLKQSDTAQLLLCTHYDGLFDQSDLLRNENIWFTSKNKDGSTELYSLSDFKGVNRISSLQKAYKYGKFGAVPNI